MALRCMPVLPLACLAVWLTLPVAAAGQLQTSRTTVAAGQAAEPMPAGEPPPPEPPSTIRRDEQGRVSIRAVRVSRLRVDGVLDEDVYRTTPPIEGFIQQEPREGDPASETTRVWVLFDDENLYVAARCLDSEPGRMVLTEMRRDNYGVSNNESFTVGLDTFRDRRNGYYFEVSALGALRDGLITDEVNANFDWNAVHDARVRLHDRGYDLELVIPFKSIRYRPGADQIWGIHLRRVIRWKNEQVFITHVPASYAAAGIYRFSLAAALYGLEVPATSKNLELKPYAISDLRTDKAATPPYSNDPGADAGFDVKYGLTRSLIADFTYNTDFAQVEDDQQQVNLTRFTLFFPEKREFFLENQGIFVFGGSTGGSSWEGGNLTPVFFFSRSIGLSRGQPVPIVAGGRVTGRAGAYTLGLINIETGRPDALSEEPTNFSVVRVRRDILRRSNVGVMAMNRSRSVKGAGSNQAFGLDANLAFYQDVTIQAYYAESRSPGRPDDEVSYYGNFSYAADRYGLSYQRLAVGRHFNPEIGFVRRTDFERHYASARFSPRPERWKSVRRFSYVGSFDYITNRGGRLETREGKGSFETQFQNSDEVRLDYADTLEYLPEPFGIAGDVTIPIGGYRFRAASLMYAPGSQRRVSGWYTITHGSFYGGTKTAFTCNSGRVKISYRFLVEPSFSFNLVHLPYGEFTSNVVSARTTYMFSPRSFLSALLQYNSGSRTFTSNVRFRWEYQPNSEIFLVYSEGRDTGGAGFPALQNRGVIVKLTKLFRF